MVSRNFRLKGVLATMPAHYRRRTHSPVGNFIGPWQSTQRLVADDVGHKLRRNGYAERARRLEVDHEFDFRRLLDQ